MSPLRPLTANNNPKIKNSFTEIMVTLMVVNTFGDWRYLQFCGVLLNLLYETFKLFLNSKLQKVRIYIQKYYCYKTFRSLYLIPDTL